MWHFLNIFHRGVVQTHNRKTLKSLKITDLASAPMNKKHSRNNSKDQGRSKDTKWIRPKGYYCRYERERRREGKRIRTRTKALLTLLNDIYEPRSATGKRMISYLACLVDKEFRGHSYRSHVSYIEPHQGLLHMYDLKRVPSKSCLHHAAVVLAGCARMQEVVGMLAGDAARGSLLGDSSGFSIMQYEDWEDAKRGIISRRRFVKLHVLADARGKRIVSCEVTKGTAHDSPWFRRIFARVPGGAGCVMLDAAYDAYENYRVIRNSGRRPAIDPCKDHTRKDHTLKGYNPRAEVLRWRKENPEEFERTYHRRSLAESVFLSLKAMFGAVVAAKTLPLQRLQLILRSICYNMLS